MDIFAIMFISIGAIVIFFFAIFTVRVYITYRVEENQDPRVQLPVQSVILVEGEAENSDTTHQYIDIVPYRNNTVLPIMISSIDYKDAKYIVYATIV